MSLKSTIFSHLLFRANSVAKDDMFAAPRTHFYAIKDRLLKQYGKIVGQDIQYIEGKKCWSCDGTGVYMNYYHGRWHHETCYKCNYGWYKRPQWILLDRVQIGKFTFHRPVQKIYSIVTPYFGPPTIEGYIEHSKKKYGDYALMILYLMYDRYAAKRLWQAWGFGFRTYWYYPQNWIRTIAHISTRRWESVPLGQLRQWWRRKPWAIANRIKINVESDELPF